MRWRSKIPTPPRTLLVVLAFYWELLTRDANFVFLNAAIHAAMLERLGNAHLRYLSKTTMNESGVISYWMYYKSNLSAARARAFAVEDGSSFSSDAFSLNLHDITRVTCCRLFSIASSYRSLPYLTLLSVTPEGEQRKMAHASTCACSIFLNTSQLGVTTYLGI